MPVKKVDTEKLEQALRDRQLMRLKTGRTPCWDTVADALGISDRQLRRIRATPLWHKALATVGGCVDEELVIEARLRLGQLLYDSDPRVCLEAAKTVLHHSLTDRLERAPAGTVVNVATFDLSGLSLADLRSLATTAASIEGHGPGARRLPAATVTVEDAPEAPGEALDAEEVGGDD